MNAYNYFIQFIHIYSSGFSALMFGVEKRQPEILLLTQANGRCVFSVATPELWNDLPDNVRDTNSIDSFLETIPNFFNCLLRRLTLVLSI